MAVAARLIATQLRIQGVAYDIAVKYNTSHTAIAERGGDALHVGAAAALIAFFDPSAEMLVSMPHSLFSVGGSLSLSVWTASILRERALLRYALLTEKPYSRILGTGGDPLLTALKVPYVKESLEYLPATLSDMTPAEVDEAALTLIAAMNPHVKLDE